MVTLDQKYTGMIGTQCTTDDKEANGHHLDAVILTLLTELGMEETIKAFRDVECYRC